MLSCFYCTLVWYQINNILMLYLLYCTVWWLNIFISSRFTIFSYLICLKKHICSNKIIFIEEGHHHSLHIHKLGLCLMHWHNTSPVLKCSSIFFCWASKTHTQTQWWTHVPFFIHNWQVPIRSYCSQTSSISLYWITCPSSYRIGIALVQNQHQVFFSKRCFRYSTFKRWPAPTQLVL